jgi:hypothetical protein
MASKDGLDAAQRAKRDLKEEMKALFKWYIACVPLGLVRVGMMALVLGLGVDALTATIVVWFAERPLYFYTARYVDRR